MPNAKDDRPKRGHGPVVTDDPRPGGKPEAETEEEANLAHDEEGREQTIPTPTPPEVKEEAR
jgi:hypothetical protein